MQSAQNYTEQTKSLLLEKYLKDLPAKAPLDKQVIFQYITDDFDYANFPNAEAIKNFALSWQPSAQQVEIFDKNYSCPPRPLNRAHKDNGWENKNKQMVSALRSIGKQVVVLIGKKIMSGSLNLTQISFPIKSMIPKSALEKALISACMFPLYMNRAAHIDDKVERMKLVITACISNFHYNQGFSKPLNPILGETCEGEFEDGTQAYAEQISHHPPVSYFMIKPKDNSYTYYGNYNYSSKAYMNSLELLNSGSRNVYFKKDGQKITYNFAKETYSGIFWGALKIETKGQLIFEDKQNKLKAIINFEKGFKQQNYGDEFAGEITQDGKCVSQIRGSYISHIDFDNYRYFDYQTAKPFKIKINNNSILESDQGYRKDKNWVLQGHIDQAQKYKEELEGIQREDAKKRKNYIQSHHLKEKYDNCEDINL
ncbi:hypothetical protein PPERSA_05801 [Pseudocohnilembus persalinus]|uniref:Oxysterol-binding protein n=1 Tax=Pseudocohnilembus persalinus TaxID=266149 RepID=A0A0V0R0A4_PSEPJ|nr:hypothetical protein PPERSA_05801 [Pseudocohnilembus persalinus]|eukprot:KRX07738.1 hypothetical protein PPERSA_05801 [Pseudocohnilembus persalinus]